MAAGRNKVLLDLAGKPVLLYSVDTFRACCQRLLVVAAAADLADVQALVPDLQVVAGGPTRHASEWNALQALRDGLNGGDVVAIHDAARPLVASADVEAVFAAAEQVGAAMLAEPALLPVLEMDQDRVLRAHPADNVWRAQTPQAARADLLLAAYAKADAEGIAGTDTAAVLERYGVAVRVVAATAPNPKITLPADLAAAAKLI